MFAASIFSRIAALPSGRTIHHHSNGARIKLSVAESKSSWGKPPGTSFSTRRTKKCTAISRRKTATSTLKKSHRGERSILNLAVVRFMAQSSAISG